MEGKEKKKKKKKSQIERLSWTIKKLDNYGMSLMAEKNKTEELGKWKIGETKTFKMVPDRKMEIG